MNFEETRTHSLNEIFAIIIKGILPILKQQMNELVEEVF